MIHPYPRKYVGKMASLVGNTFAFAIHYCDIKSDDFVNLFIASSICTKIEKGDVYYVIGRSPIDLAAEIIYETTELEVDRLDPERYIKLYREGWIGECATYYHWMRGRTFREIFQVAPMEVCYELYVCSCAKHPLDFIDEVDSRFEKYNSITNLQRIRTLHGCTQEELAEQSGVDLRSIQMYEEGTLDINKAEAEAVYGLARTLGCDMEDLVEFKDLPYNPFE